MQVRWNSIIQEINDTEGNLLLAVSGGVDSVFMLEFMVKNASRPIRAAHFNHRLRQQSIQEEKLVRELCDRHSVELHVGYGDPDRMRASPSLEAEARRQRYAFFDTVKRSGELLTTAHHANDQMETIILRLMRGYPHSNLRIQKFSGDRYRPFLDVPKDEIVRQARNRGYDWLEDESNAEIHHERNWVRHVIIPEMMTRRNVLKSIVFNGSMNDLSDGDTIIDSSDPDDFDKSSRSLFKM